VSRSLSQIVGGPGRASGMISILASAYRQRVHSTGPVEMECLTGSRVADSLVAMHPGVAA